LITSSDNPKLKLIRNLARRRGMFVAEGEDLVDAADRADWRAEFVLRAGIDVDARLLASVSTLGSGTRVIGVYRERWSEPGGDLSVYLHGVRDPGNIGTIIRSAHAFADGPVVLGPGCADPFSPKAVRASMGSIFARPPCRATFSELPGTTIALVPDAPLTVSEAGAEPPASLCLGSERHGLPRDLVAAAEVVARIPIRRDGPDSLNVAMAATVALYERNRMGDHA
jgi:RNA methyltransferase, TrmH family